MANKSELTVIGIGYVGLPLAISLAKFFYVNAYDVDKNRIIGLKKNYDITNEFSFNEIKKTKSINFTSNEKDLITELNNCINRLYNQYLKRQKQEQGQAIDGLGENTNDSADAIDGVLKDSLKTNELLKKIQSNQNN